MLDQLHIEKFFSQGQCPYLAARKNMAYAFSIEEMVPGLYEALISQGFRRNGFHFYKNICPNCDACIPIRVDVRRFRPSKSQRRVLRKNQDIRITRQRVCFDPEDFSLYRKYCRIRHDSPEHRQDYTRFLIDSPLATEMMRYYAGDHLIGIGWIDVLPNSLSSVYFVFDPDHSSRSIGVFSLLKELELCRTLGKAWLQLGFWIKDNRKMSYKNRYKPCQLLIKGKWQDFSENLSRSEKG